MITIVKNNILRISKIKVNVTIYIVLTVCSVFVAMYMSGTQQSVGNIAVLSQDKAKIQESEQLHVTYVAKEVPQSTLVMQKYDAYVYVNDKGKYIVKTVKGEDFQKRIEAFLLHQQGSPIKQDEGKGSRIIGYLTMFVMMQSIAYMSLFGEDKETNMVQRIMVSSLSFSAYLSAQVIFVILCTFLPAFLTIATLSLTGFDIGFSLLEYVGLLGLLSLFSTVFTLFMNSIISVRDTANMAGSAIIVLTSILSGTFTSIPSEHTILHAMNSCLPQRVYLNITQALEQSAFTQNDWMQFAYLIIFIIVLFICSILAMKRGKRT